MQKEKEAPDGDNKIGVSQASILKSVAAITKLRNPQNTKSNLTNTKQDPYSVTVEGKVPPRKSMENIYQSLNEVQNSKLAKLNYRDIAYIEQLY